jgi:hypothetical protein
MDLLLPVHHLPCTHNMSDMSDNAPDLTQELARLNNIMNGRRCVLIGFLCGTDSGHSRPRPLSSLPMLRDNGQTDPMRTSPPVRSFALRSTSLTCCSEPYPRSSPGVELHEECNPDGDEALVICSGGGAPLLLYYYFGAVTKADMVRVCTCTVL